MTHDRGVAQLEQFLAERGESLLRAAALLTGSRDADLAEQGRFQGSADGDQPD